MGGGVWRERREAEGRQPGEERRREGKRRLDPRHAGGRSRREVEGSKGV